MRSESESVLARQRRDRRRARGVEPQKVRQCAVLLGARLAEVVRAAPKAVRVIGPQAFSRRSRRLGWASIQSTTSMWSSSSAASRQSARSHGQPWATAHLSTLRWPPAAAVAQTPESQGQSWARAHLSTSSWPPWAAIRQVPWHQGQSLSRSHWRTCRWPHRAAAPLARPSGGTPWAQSHWRTWRWPPSAAAALARLVSGQPSCWAHFRT
mmetsp:Transcript_10410/g.35359  ORF Transcript_10410/g.35359 Transcript_10410/m.35359 type:complete len:210 (-) Transcript_10410:62-691(-)